MKRSRFTLVVLAAIAVAGIGAAGMVYTRPARVAVVHPRRGDAVDLVYATGFVEPVQPVAVAARLTAPVSAVLVDEGDAVHRGQALVRLDDSDLRGAWAQAHALGVGATLTEQRNVTLFRQGWVTRAARDVAVANGAAARAAEAVAAAKLGQNVLRSGIDGIVIKRDIEPGELAVPSRVLMLLGDPRRSRITATIDERDVPHLRVGQRAMVSSDAWPGRVLRAHVAELTPTGDPEQRAFRARLLLDEQAQLPLGMSLEINIVTREAKGVLLLPNSAFAGNAVWTIEDGRAHRRPVATGIRGQTSSAVAGVAQDTTVIDLPAASLREGDRVVAAR